MANDFCYHAVTLGFFLFLFLGSKSGVSFISEGRVEDGKQEKNESKEKIQTEFDL